MFPCSVPHPRLAPGFDISNQAPASGTALGLLPAPLMLETRADGVEPKSDMVRRMAGGCRTPRTAPRCSSSNAGRRPCAVLDSPAACRWRDLVLAYLQHQHRTNKPRPTLESLRLTPNSLILELVLGEGECRRRMPPISTSFQRLPELPARSIPTIPAGDRPKNAWPNASELPSISACPPTAVARHRSIFFWGRLQPCLRAILSRLCIYPLCC